MYLCVRVCALVFLCLHVFGFVVVSVLFSMYGCYRIRVRVFVGESACVCVCVLVYPRVRVSVSVR
jgi:hypothetical protein